jgi:phi13 family phage major tail protein
MSGSNPVIGLDNVVIARLLSDVGGTTPPTYDTPVALAGAVMASRRNNGEVAVDYADNGAFFAANSRGNTELTLELTNVVPSTYALILGMNRANGITQEKSMDQSPFFAVGFRVWIGGEDGSGNKIYKYYWMLKGKFSVPDDGAETKKESLNFQHISLNALFVKTQYSAAGDGNGLLVNHARSDYDLTSAQAAAWFNAPVVVTSADTGAVTVTGALSGGNVVLTGAKVGGGSFSFAQETVVKGSSLLIQKGGVELAGALTFSAAGVAPTITFTPTVAFTSGSHYVTVTSAVRDNNGVAVTPYTVELTV